MTLIARPPKQGGFLTYAEKVLAGFTKIIDTEADADLDTIYFDYNGFIGNENIRNSANIAYSKLNLTGQIVDADIAANAAIKGTKLADAPDGVPTAKINDGAVTGVKLADAPNGITTGKINDLQVTNGKLAPFATIRNTQQTSFNLTTLSGTVAESPPVMTTAPLTIDVGGMTAFFLEWGCVSTFRSYPFGSGLNVRLRMNGVQIFNRNLLGFDQDNLRTAVFIPSPTFFQSTAPGTYVYTVTLQPGDADMTVVLTSGTFTVLHFA